MIKKSLSSVLFCATLAHASPEDLNSHLSHFTSLQAHFTATTTAQNKAPTLSSGTLSIEKPNRFNYHVLTPNEEIFISDGKKVWNIEPDLEQVTVTPLQQNLSTTPLLLLSGSIADLSQLFFIQTVSPEHYILTPKSADSMIKKIDIRFDQQSIIQSLALTNTLGQTSTLVFTQVKLNSPPPAALFYYQQEPGIQVLS